MNSSSANSDVAPKQIVEQFIELIDNYDYEDYILDVRDQIFRRIHPHLGRGHGNLLVLRGISQFSYDSDVSLSIVSPLKPPTIQ